MTTKEDKVVLVDSYDNAIGIMNKTEAHEKGLLHRAFSVLLFNDSNEMLLQQRAINKYHCGGLWTNTCCSHPFPNEDVLTAAERRLKEEMGITCLLEKSFCFIYKASLENSLTEHEFDHVFFGRYNNTLLINTNEVADWQYISLRNLKKQMAHNPNNYTPWFKIIISKIAGEKLAAF